MPVRLAFIDNPIEWVVVDWIIDGIFMVDICMNFFTAYFDAEDSLVTSRKVIMNVINNLNIEYRKYFEIIFWDGSSSTSRASFPFNSYSTLIVSNITVCLS